MLARMKSRRNGLQKKLFTNQTIFRYDILLEVISCTDMWQWENKIDLDTNYSYFVAADVLLLLFPGDHEKHHLSSGRRNINFLKLEEDLCYSHFNIVTK